MRYTEFEQEFLVAAYLWTESKPRTIPSAGDILDSYLVNANEGWVHRLMQDFASRGLIAGKGNIGGERGQPIRLTAQGFREAERLMDRGIEVYPRQSGIQQLTDATSSNQQVVHSAAWTGLPPGFVFSDEKRSNVVAQLDKAEQGLVDLDLGQESYSQVRSYIVAAKALAEAPEPQVDLIWEVINRANAVAGVASLFISILALFIH